MNKVDIQTFLIDLLSKHGCKGIKTSRTDINCSCPFHESDSNNITSFGISFVKEDKGYPFRCYSPLCKKVGNILTLIAHLNKCDYKKALKIFNKRVVVKPVNLKVLNELYEKVREVNTFMENEKITKFPLISDNINPMIKYLKWRNKEKQHNLMDIHFIVKKYGLYYCREGRYAGRIIMPIRNIDGEWIHFNDRIIEHNAKRKSLHAAGKAIEHCLHGIYTSYGKPIVIVTEGAFDMFQCVSAIRDYKEFDQYGVVNCMGALITEARAALLAEIFEKVYLMFDHDEAGIAGAYAAEQLLLDYMKVENITERLPKHKDPAICTGSQIRKALRIKKSISIKRYYESLGFKV